MGGDLEIRALKAQTRATTLAHHYRADVDFEGRQVTWRGAFHGFRASGFEAPTSWSRTRRANRAALRPALLGAQTHHTHRRTEENGCPAAALRVSASVRLLRLA